MSTVPSQPDSHSDDHSVAFNSPQSASASGRSGDQKAERLDAHPSSKPAPKESWLPRWRSGASPDASSETEERVKSVEADSRSDCYPFGVPRRLHYPHGAANGLLERAARELPNSVGAEFLGHRMTYQELDRKANRLAAYFQLQGIQPGDRIGVLLPNCPEYLIALNAIWKAGCVAVAISPLSAPHNVEQLVDRTQCRVVVSLDLLIGLIRDCEIDQVIEVSFEPYLPARKRMAYRVLRYWRTRFGRVGNRLHRLSMRDVLKRSRPDVVPVEVIPAQTPAFLLSTGGTTASAKIVTLSHRNIVANAWQQMHWAGASFGQETMLAVLPFFHSYGMSTLLTTGCALGARIIMQPRYRVSEVIRTIEEHRPTVFHAVPAMLIDMNEQLRETTADLSSLKWVISGGASLPEQVATEFRNYCSALVVEGYGLSEASPVTHVGPLDGSNRTGTIGLPLPDTECRIVSTEVPEQEVEPDAVGELCVRGPQVMLGYWDDSQSTSQTIQDGWLHTGDLAVRNQDGFFRIVDRKKDLIITSGFNVYPADVEEALKRHPDIQDVAVVGVPHLRRGEVVKAYLVMKPGVTLNTRTLRTHCAQTLPAPARPKHWEVVQGDLPRNFLGKVLRRELRRADSALPGETK